MLETYKNDEEEICALLSKAIGTLEYENNGLNYEELSISALEEAKEYIDVIIKKAKEVKE